MTNRSNARIVSVSKRTKAHQKPPRTEAYMNAIHPIFAAALAPIAPPPRFLVTIKFSDGEYKNHVTADTARHAEHMALVDARMASPYGSYSGKVLSSEARLD